MLNTPRRSCAPCSQGPRGSRSHVGIQSAVGYIYSAGFGLALAWLWLDFTRVLAGFGLDLVGFQLLLGFQDASSISLVAAFLHFWHILTSFAVLIRSETTFGQVPGWVESHGHP